MPALRTSAAPVASVQLVGSYYAVRHPDEWVRNAKSHIETQGPLGGRRTLCGLKARSEWTEFLVGLPIPEGNYFDTWRERGAWNKLCDNCREAFVGSLG